MWVLYDQQVDVLRIMTDTPEAICASLLYDHNIAVSLATEDGHDIVGLEILGASAFIPLGNRGYDAETDTLTMGRTTGDPDLITENGDLVAYWQVDEEYPDRFRDPVGVAIRRASVHLAKVSAELVGVLV
ncbi:MAG: DUF2283 domain-containing protein [Dehalococcoidia bacterium]|nr:DUF2283 domain-containing protein [Dehalococcoidia bacterium]